MITVLIFAYLALSSLYTLSFAAASWKDNKHASAGGLLIVFVSIAAALFTYLRD